MGLFWNKDPFDTLVIAPCLEKLRHVGTCGVSLDGLGKSSPRNPLLLQDVQLYFNCCALDNHIGLKAWVCVNDGQNLALLVVPLEVESVHPNHVIEKRWPWQTRWFLQGFHLVGLTGLALVVVALADDGLINL